MEVTILQAVLHVLDTTVSMPIYSEDCLDLRVDLENYLISQIEKSADNENGKKCIFEPHSDFPVALDNIETAFVPVTQKIGEEIFKVMLENPEIPRADLICALCEIDGERSLAVMKLNYRDGYSHYYHQEEDRHTVSVVTQQTLLPAANSKPEEAFVITLSTKEILLTEKKYEIDGAKGFYLSPRILICRTGTAEKAKFNAVKKTVEKINDEYFAENKEVQQEVASLLHAEFAENETVVIEDLCQNLYKNYPQAASTLVEKLEKVNIDPEETITVSPSTVKRLEKQSIKTSSGIEIKIPVNLYKDNDSVEFINNPDGTISILVKNVML